MSKQPLSQFFGKVRQHLEFAFGATVALGMHVGERLAALLVTLLKNLLNGLDHLPNVILLTGGDTLDVVCIR